jgi:RNA polymerase sigma factor (sigma-70 family)
VVTFHPSPYEQHRDYVLAVLARRCAWLDPSDREALFHDAYALFLEKQRDGQLDAGAMRAPQVRAYLTQTALNKAMDESKRAGRRRSVPLDDDMLCIDPADPERGLDERLEARLEDARIREIVAELPERQQVVIKLRFFFGRSPREIQRYLGVSERIYRRELERATRQIAARYQQVRQGTFCEERRSLILAYVTGIAGPNRAISARQHLNSCPACASWATEVRRAAARAASAVPCPRLEVVTESPSPANWMALLHREDRGNRAGTSRTPASVLPLFDRSRPPRGRPYGGEFGSPDAPPPPAA